MLRFWVRFGIVQGCLIAAVAGAAIDPLVVSVQNVLREEGVFPYNSTGSVDTRTVAAIRHYQILQGMRVTGRLDAQTLSAMHLTAPLPPPEILAEDRRFLKDLTTPHRMRAGTKPGNAIASVRDEDSQPPAIADAGTVNEQPPDEVESSPAEEADAQRVTSEHRHELNPTASHRLRERHRRHR